MASEVRQHEGETASIHLRYSVPLRPESQELSDLLAKCYATPDELGAAWWAEFEAEMKMHHQAGWRSGKAEFSEDACGG